MELRVLPPPQLHLWFGLFLLFMICYVFYMYDVCLAAPMGLGSQGEITYNVFRCLALALLPQPQQN